MSSSVCNKRIFIKKYHGITGSVFKIDAIDGKMWVKFVAMQQNSATLIYGSKTQSQREVKCRAALRKIAQPFKAVQFQA